MATTKIDWTAPAAKVWPGYTVVEEFLTPNSKTRYCLQVHPCGSAVLTVHSRVDSRQYKSYGKPCHSFNATGSVEHVRKQFEQTRGE